MYDLLLKGAHVVDPLNGVNGVNDVAVEGGKVAAVGPDLTRPRSHRCFRMGAPARHHRQSRASRQYVGVALRTAYARDERRDDVSRHGRSLG